MIDVYKRQVEMIYRIYLKNGNVKVKDVASELNIKPASVTKMVKKLDEKGVLAVSYTHLDVYKRQYCGVEL